MVKGHADNVLIITLFLDQFLSALFLLLKVNNRFGMKNLIDNF